MSDTSRVLLAAAVLSGAAIAMLAWRVTRFDPSMPDRLIGELGVARWAAVLLATVGAIAIGFAAAADGVPGSNADAAIGFIFVGIAGLVLQREPRDGLFLSAVAFVAHALIDIAHRPGWLPADVLPHWYTVGCAVYDVGIAGLCYWTRRR